MESLQQPAFSHIGSRKPKSMPQDRSTATMSRKKKTYTKTEQYKTTASSDSQLSDHVFRSEQKRRIISSLLCPVSHLEGSEVGLK